MRRIFLIVIVLGLGLSSCNQRTSTPVLLPTEQSYAPQPGDSALLRTEVYLESSEVRNLNSDPSIIVLDLRGNLPNPCHQLRVIVPAPNGQNQILIDVYSVAKPDEICIAMLQPFDTSVVLGKFPGGVFTVWVNGQQVGEFDAQ
jgi:hypothetical protein